MKITSFEHGCEVCGYDPIQLPIISHLPEKHQKAQIAAYKLFVISEASWKGDNVAQDWNDDDQEKWSPWFWMDDPGFRFFASCYVCAGTIATGGSRLCYPSRKDSDYHGTQHLELYRDLHCEVK